MYLTPFQSNIHTLIVSIGKSDISREEKLVLRYLLIRWQAKKEHTTQKEITYALPELFEGMTSVSDETLFRYVRRIIRTLRIERYAPILSDRKGYYLPLTESECREYLVRMENKARAQAAAWFETYRSVKESLGISSEFFEEQGRLFYQKSHEINNSETRDGVQYETYHVPGKGYFCTCPGFKYRKTCKHVEAMRTQVVPRYPQD